MRILEHQPLATTRKSLLVKNENNMASLRFSLLGHIISHLFYN